MTIGDLLTLDHLSRQMLAVSRHIAALKAAELTGGTPRLHNLLVNAEQHLANAETVLDAARHEAGLTP